MTKAQLQISRQAKWLKTEKGKAYLRAFQKAYRKTAKYKAYQKAYKKAYRKTAKYKAYWKAYYLKVVKPKKLTKK
jgi:hypothetical protein